MPVPYETAYGPIAAVAEWLRANDIDPNDVPINGPITIERDTASDGTRIRYTAVVRTEGVGVQYDARRRGPKVEDRTVPLKVEPPANVQVTGSN